MVQAVTPNYTQWQQDRDAVLGGRYRPGFSALPYPTDMQGADSRAQWDAMNQSAIGNNMNNRAYEYGLARDAMFDAAEAERQARIESALGKVSSMFAGRTPMYNQYANDTFNLSKVALDDEQLNQAQQLKFALARSGLSGGSADIDKHADLGNKYSFGLQQARGFADAAGDQLRGQDSSLKSSLMGLAASGAVGGSQIGSIGADAMNAIDTTPTAMSNPGQFYTGLFDQIGAAGGQQVASGVNPFAPSGASSTFRPTPGGGGYKGTVS